MDQAMLFSKKHLPLLVVVGTDSYQSHSQNSVPSENDRRLKALLDVQGVHRKTKPGVYEFDAKTKRNGETKLTLNRLRKS